MTMGMVPLAIQEPMRRPTESMIRMAGSALRMLSTMPRSMSRHLKPSRRPRNAVTVAAATSRIWALIL